MNNVGKGKRIVSPVVFQGGVSKNEGVVAAFERALGHEIIVDSNGHLMGAIGIAILAKNAGIHREFDFNIGNTDFYTREVSCGRCANNCEIICVYKDKKLIDAWGNRCERGQISVQK